MDGFIDILNNLPIEKLALVLSFVLCFIVIFRVTIQKWIPDFLFEILKSATEKVLMISNRIAFVVPNGMNAAFFEIPISRKTVLEFNQNVIVNNPDNFLKKLNIIADYHRATGMAMTYGLVDIKDSNKMFEDVFFDHIEKQIDKNNILIKIIFPNNSRFDDLQNLIESHIKRTGKRSVQIVVDGYRRSGEIPPLEQAALKYGSE